ncbi:MAG TPA: hypothetical protein VF707_00715 [Ardenticatenaceae bacterium]|jgi:hypothetical protein
MRWLRRGEGKKEKGGALTPDEARAALADLRQQIAAGMQAQQWSAVADDMVLAMQFLRDTSATTPVTQSTLAELYSQWAIAINEQRRYEEAYTMLQTADLLWNLEHEQAVAWAREQGITLQGEGTAPDLGLVLAVLAALSENAARFDSDDTGRILTQMVAVADLAGDEQARWMSRSRLASWSAEEENWRTLLTLAREMVALAREQGDLLRLLEAMRQFAEAYAGMGDMSRTIEVQRLVVEIARTTNHPSLEREREELRNLLDATGDSSRLSSH